MNDEKLAPRLCEWLGCKRIFPGDAIPDGWCWGAAYWSPRERARGFVLCPQHAAELEARLKAIGDALIGEEGAA